MARVIALCWLLALTPQVFVQPPKPGDNRPILDILDDVKTRAAEQKQEDQRRALLLLQRAESLRRAGRSADALAAARQAQVLFPESPDIRQFAAGLAAELRGLREDAAQVTAAVQALEEALEHSRLLLKARRLSEALEIADAARQSLELFTPLLDLTGVRTSIDDVIAEVAARSGPQLEAIPVPPLPVPDLPLTPSDMRLMLARRVDVEWRDQPLSLVFPIILQETGLQVKVDPVLERLGVFEQHTDLRIHNVPIERLLRMVAEMAGASYILRDGEVYLTTKANAVAQAVARPEGRIEVLPPRRTVARPLDVPPPGALLPPPVVEQTPGWLLSGKALREHVAELLRRPEQPLRPAEGK